MPGVVILNKGETPGGTPCDTPGDTHKRNQVPRLCILYPGTDTRIVMDCIHEFSNTY